MPVTLSMEDLGLIQYPFKLMERLPLILMRTEIDELVDESILFEKGKMMIHSHLHCLLNPSCTISVLL